MWGLILVYGPHFTSRTPRLQSGGHLDKRPRTGATLIGRPSCVRVLRNMVGPGEVDEDLEEEVWGVWGMWLARAKAAGAHGCTA